MCEQCHRSQVQLETLSLLLFRKLTREKLSKEFYYIGTRFRYEGYRLTLPQVISKHSTVVIVRKGKVTLNFTCDDVVRMLRYGVRRTIAPLFCERLILEL